MRYAIILALLAGTAYAQGVTFANVCSGFTLKQSAKGLEIWCPGKPLPWMTITACPKGVTATASQNNATGLVTITCDGGTFGVTNHAP